MKTSTISIIAIVIIILVLLGGAYFLLQKGGTSSATVTGTATTTIDGTTMAAPQKLIMTNGVSVSYYADTYGLAVNADQMPKNSYIPPCEQGFSYCLYRVGTDYANTNLESAGIAIQLRTDLKTETACLTTKPDGYTNLTASTTSGTGYSTSAFAPLGDAGAGHYSSGAEYRLWAGSSCTQFTTRIGETQFANYPAGAKTEFTAADRKSVQAELSSLLYDVKFKDAAVKFPGI